MSERITNDIPTPFLEAFKNADTYLLDPSENTSLLTDTGFNARLSISSFRRNLEQNLNSGLSFAEAIYKPLDEMRGDIIGYKLEYIMQEPLLPNPIEKRYYQGRERVFNKFSNKPLSEGILVEERDGAVANSLVQVEEFLLNSPEGSVAAMVSPAGWSGLKDQNGQDFNYPDTQIYMWQVGKDGKLESFTLVLDELDLEDCLQILEYLGVSTQEMKTSGLSERQILSKIVGSPALLQGNQAQKFVIEDVIRTVQHVKGSDVVRVTHGDRPEVRTFSEVYQNLKRADALLASDQICEDLISDFMQKAYFSSDSLANPIVFNTLKQELEILILNMSKAIKGENIEQRDYAKMTTYEIRQVFSSEIRYLQSIPGCAGGGLVKQANGTWSLENFINTGLSYRRRETSSSVKCPHCDFVNTCNKDICHQCKQSMKSSD